MDKDDIMRWVAIVIAICLPFATLGILKSRAIENLTGINGYIVCVAGMVLALVVVFAINKKQNEDDL